jgi:phospholipase/lecithinase/hemolysin
MTTSVCPSSTSASSSSSGPTQTGTPSTGLRYFISFGDSYSQTGFDYKGTKPSANSPLGNPPLPGWTASGGLNWVGFMVTEFNTSLTLSYNFAYGGATVDARLVKPYASTVKSFIDQVTDFSAELASHPSYAPWTADNTVVAVWMGVNDVGNSYWTEDEDELIKKIMAKYFEQLQIVYDAGARKFVLLSVPRKFDLTLAPTAIYYHEIF